MDKDSRYPRHDPRPGNVLCWHSRFSKRVWCAVHHSLRWTKSLVNSQRAQLADAFSCLPRGDAPSPAHALAHSCASERSAQSAGESKQATHR